MTYTNFLVVVAVSVCFYGTSAFLVNHSHSHSSSGSGSVSGNGDASSKAQVNISLGFENKAVLKFVGLINSLFQDFEKLTESLLGNSAVAGSATLKLFVDPLSDFFKLFENIAFTSAHQFAESLTSGINDLELAIKYGWTLVSDLTGDGEEIVATSLSAFLTGLEALLSFAQGLSVVFHVSGGVSGGGSGSAHAGGSGGGGASVGIGGSSFAETAATAATAATS